MRVLVLRVKDMPHGVGAWIDDQPDLLVLYLDEQIITETGARLIQAALSFNTSHWLRSPNLRERPHLRLHTG